MKQTSTNSYKMLFVIRQDLKMGKGKIVSQCCHATLKLYKKLNKNSLYSKDLDTWENRNGSKKVSLKCKDLKELTKIIDNADKMNIPYVTIRDAGRTEVEENTLTVIALFDKESRLNQICNHLKLL